MEKIRTRIAPSPTGVAHVGTAYAALFNWAYARGNKGEFILRVEDTDQKRNIKVGEEIITKGLKWLGLSWDKFYRQSDRKEIYQKYAQKLIKEGKAFEKEGGIILELNSEEDVSWTDLIRGKISFPKEEIKDLVIIKKDGFPTYNFAVVVDDHEMKISHVIRAEDHISNTPRQIMSYKAFDWSLPKFAHFPLLRNKDRSKLSKRTNPISLNWYKDEGFLPESLVNYLSLLGWSHPEGREIFDLKEFAKEFTLDRVKKTGPIFDLDKLKWINGEYIRKAQSSKLKAQIFSYFDEKYSQDKIEKIIPLVQNRINTLKEFESLAGFFFEAPTVDKKKLGKSYKKHLQAAKVALEAEEPLESVPQKNGFKTGDFFMDLRIAITGQKVTPPINESIDILGKDEAIARIKKLL